MKTNFRMQSLIARQFSKFFFFFLLIVTFNLPIYAISVLSTTRVNEIYDRW